MKDTDIAYLAGILDGEGCIHIKRNKRKDCPKGVQYQLGVTVRMSNESICQLYQKYFGGRVYQCKKYKSYYKQLWQWIVTSKQASAFLRIVLPYLIDKKTEAILGLEFQDAKMPVRAKMGHRGFISQPAEIVAIEESQYILMKNLHNKSEAI